MATSFSHWRTPGAGSVWRHGPSWAKPFVVAAPWIAFALALGALSLAQNRLAAAPGTVFDLPAGECTESEAAPLVALILPLPGRSADADADPAASETMVFFDDARYILSDPASREALSEALSARAGAVQDAALLAMIDRRVPTGETMAFANLARAAGIRRVQVAERKAAAQP